MCSRGTKAVEVHTSVGHPNLPITVGRPTEKPINLDKNIVVQFCKGIIYVNDGNTSPAVFVAFTPQMPR